MRGRGASKGQGKSGSNFCICTKCNYKVVHIQGKPCKEMTCPNCGTQLFREGVVNKNSAKNNSTNSTVNENIKKPEVNASACLGCMACMSVCPSGAITNPDGCAFIVDALCNNCRHCIQVCPADAIS